MASINYVCTRCGSQQRRSSLVVKRVQFTEMGEGAKTLKSRVVDWLCNACRESDADYLLEKFEPPKVGI